ncbi:MAG: hypothetical protein PHR24_01705 [Oscillospiraceae bacterium]|nr:hypothetical protein [Oscillospiraceae bacterium]MDD4545994.1 hypothetical protein [Oscillospiraceae bacterium]
MPFVEDGRQQIMVTGDYRPVMVMDGYHTVFRAVEYTKSGVLLSFEGTYNDRIMELSLQGKIVQNATPTPDSPIPITGVQPSKVTVNGTHYPLSLPALYKGDTVDLISGTGKQNTGVKWFNGTENWDMYWQGGGAVQQIQTFHIDILDNRVFEPTSERCSIVGRNNYIITSKEFFWMHDAAQYSRLLYIGIDISRLGMTVENSRAEVLAGFKGWLATNPFTVTYKLAIPATISLSPMNMPTIPVQTIISADGAEITATVRLADIT